jgi:hypothetical protein
MPMNIRVLPVLLLAFGLPGVPIPSGTRAATQVPAEPAITAQPQNQTVNAPAPATFTVTATGTPAPTFQWRKNGADLPGATRPSYTTPATTPADNGEEFTVVVSNGVGNPVISDPAILTVN